MIDYKNPIGVSVCMINIKTGNIGEHFLLVQRNIDPHIGKFALPGGFINENETAEFAASRELEEETGIKISPDKFFPVFTKITPNNRLLIFMKSTVVLDKKFIVDYKFKENAEVLSLNTTENIDIREIPFNLHAEAISFYQK